MQQVSPLFHYLDKYITRLLRHAFGTLRFLISLITSALLIPWKKISEGFSDNWDTWVVMILHEYRIMKYLLL